MRYGLIRLDIEDFLTPQSDDGLEAMLDQLDRHRLPASYGVVGEKATALADRDRSDLLARLATKPALGFHSTSHSRHPTLAEDLAELDYASGVNRFLEREAVGVEAVSRLIKPPRYFTQPGGNWVPQAVTALPRLGMGIYFSEAWNSYLVEMPEPLWLEDVLHFSLPVPTPAPFLLGLPDNLDAAIQRLRNISQTVPDEGAFTIMTHPTELVSTKFWDAVNFGHGSTRVPLEPAPLRSLSDRARAIHALDQYFLAASEMPGIVWIDVVEFSARIAPRTSVEVERTAFLQAMGSRGLGPIRLNKGGLSAAECVYALAYFVVHGKADWVTVPTLKAPISWAPSESLGVPSPSQSEAETAAVQALAIMESEGALPAAVSGMAIERWAGVWAARVVGEGLRPALSFLSYVKEPSQLHWDWPIFPPEFQPYRLWQETRRLAWALAPIIWRG